MKEAKNNEILGHLPCEYSRTLWCFIACDGKIAWKWLAVDITENSRVEEWRFLVDWCLVVQVKWKLVAWKNSWRARFADKHAKTQMAPLGATLMKKSLNKSNTHSVSFMFISWQLKKFYEYQLGCLRTPNTDLSVDKLHPWFWASILWKKVRFIHGCLR